MEGMFGSEEDVKVAATFSTIPTSNNADCVIFVLFDRPCSTSEDCIIISTCNLVDKRWITGNYSRPQGHQLASLAYANGVFHCAFYLGASSVRFATFNVVSVDWVVTHYSAFPDITCFKFPSKFYLVESAGGELFFTFYGRDHDFDYHTADSRYWHIYQFDQSQRIWRNVRTLGNRALLLYGKSSSLVMSLLGAEGETKEIANKVLDFDYEWMSCSDYPSRIGNYRGMRTHCNLRVLRSQYSEQMRNVFRLTLRHFGFR